MAAKPVFEMPTLVELDADYDTALRKSNDLNAAMSGLLQQLMVAQNELIAAKAAAPAVSAEVAALLDDTATTTLRQCRERVADLSQKIANCRSALAVIADRIRALGERAGRALVSKVRPEFGRRVGRVVAALLEVEAARADVERLRDDVEREGASTGGLLGGDFHFLGDYDRRAGTSFQVQRVIREAKAGGYL